MKYFDQDTFPVRIFLDNIWPQNIKPRNYIEHRFFMSSRIRFIYSFFLTLGISINNLLAVLQKFQFE